jgi:hypothetical protein
MLFSGELSITRAGSELLDEPVVLPAVGELLLLEQAAMPAASRPAATIAATFLLVNCLGVNIVHFLSGDEG